MMFLWLAAAFAHGGPPYTDTIQQDELGNWVLATSHGYLFEDQGWDWVCEELIGEALRVGGTQGACGAPRSGRAPCV